MSNEHKDWLHDEEQEKKKTVTIRPFEEQIKMKTKIDLELEGMVGDED